jgi:hypothetical protein
LGLPPGSIRGIISLQIAVTFWLLLLVPEDNKIAMPLNLYFLLSMVLVFFVSHGKSIALRAEKTPSPLWLPGGTLRFLILGGSIALAVYLGLNHPDNLKRLNPDPAQLPNWNAYLWSLCIGFLVGLLLRILPFRHGWAFQSFQAWIAMLAMFSLLLETILQVFVKTTLTEKLDFVGWQCGVTAIVACYFGSRS